MFGNLFKQGLALQRPIFQIDGLERRPNTGFRELGSQKGVFHFVLARLLENGVVGVEASANSQPFIAGSRLYPRAAEWSLGEYLSIDDAVERASACHRQIPGGDLLVKLVDEMQEELFKSLLHCAGEILVTPRDFAVRLTGLAENFDHPVAVVTLDFHRSIRGKLHSAVAAQRHEVVQVQLESISGGGDDVAHL